jgi:hypothetical protein
LKRFVDFICRINFGCVGASWHQQAIYWPELSSLGIPVWDISAVFFTTPKPTEKATGSTVIEATRGAFRFSTGAQNKGEVKIKTPYGTLGTRG